MNFPSRKRITTELLLLIYSGGGNLYQMRAADTFTPLATKLILDAETRKIILDELYKSGGVEPVWHNMVRWARKDLVEEGYLDAFSPHGVWRLTPNGIRHAQWLLRLREEIQQKMRAMSKRTRKKDEAVR
jgi:hypothetical protein